jgi:dTDP-glucose 4,6-dehydratase
MEYNSILITGGAGFIGSNFVHYWVNKYPNCKVTVLDKLTYAGNKQSLNGILDRITFLEGDICDASFAEGAMVGIDCVVHFAAESHVDRSVLDPLIFVKTNCVGTTTLLEAAKKTGVKHFHHISTDEVFGSLPLDSNVEWTEETVYNPRSPYSASKAGSDHLVMAYFTTFGLPVTLSNCTNNYGPFMFPEKFFPLAITNILEGKKVPVYTPGNQVREWLWVEDHCKAIDLILHKGKIGEKYNVAPKEKNISNMQAIKKILEVMGVGQEMLELVGDRPGHDLKYSVDSTKIQKELGWEQEMSFEEGVKQIVDWYKANQAWWKPLKEKAININYGTK